MCSIFLRGSVQENEAVSESSPSHFFKISALFIVLHTNCGEVPLCTLHLPFKLPGFLVHSLLNSLNPSLWGNLNPVQLGPLCWYCNSTLPPPKKTLSALKPGQDFFPINVGQFCILKHHLLGLFWGKKVIYLDHCMSCLSSPDWKQANRIYNEIVYSVKSHTWCINIV